MPIDRNDFENIGESDIQELCTGGVPEGLRIEYKREIYGGSDADKKEALKDISALANADGGHLIIGVECQNGLPTGVRGIEVPNTDEAILRLEQLARSGIEPRIIGIRTRAIVLANGHYCFVMRIPKSWAAPHRVSAYGTNRYWIRNSSGAHEASVEELRSMFLVNATALQRMREFRDERVRYVCSGEGIRPLAGNGRLFVHIYPFSSFIGNTTVDLRAVQLNHQVFRPLGNLGMSPRFNLDGFINERGGDHNNGYTQVFRNGAIEATKAGIISERSGRRLISGLGTEKQFFEVVPKYIDGLRTLNIPAPLCIMITLEGVAGVAYSVRRDQWEDEELSPLSRQEIVLPECIVNEYGDYGTYCRALRPAFDALWNASGYLEAQTFNEAGEWIGRN